MKKFETEFKLEVVKSFLAGDGGAKLLQSLERPAATPADGLASEPPSASRRRR